jgi:hypothetical protein
MEIADFELERPFARWELDVDHLLCASPDHPSGGRELPAQPDRRPPTSLHADRVAGISSSKTSAPDREPPQGN